MGGRVRGCGWGTDRAAVTGEDTVPLGWVRGRPRYQQGWGQRAGVVRTHLEATEPDHTVHHLRHTEAVPEVVKGIVPVVVMYTELRGGKGEPPELGAPGSSKTPGGFACSSPKPWELPCSPIQDSAAQEPCNRLLLYPLGQGLRYPPGVY